MLKKIKLNTAVSGGFILFSLFMLYHAFNLKFWSSKYAPGPGFIPRWAGGALLVLSIIAFIQSFKEDSITLDQVLPKERSYRVNLYVCWIGLIFFLLFTKTLGFVTTGSILLIALFSRGTKWKVAIPAGIGVTLVFFFIFKELLQVQVPVNAFGF